MMNYYGNYGYPGYNFLGGMMGAWFGFLFLPLIIWSLFWKGWALWRAAKNDSKVWFTALLIVNTLGILDILYIFIFSKQKSTLKKSSRK